MAETKRAHSPELNGDAGAIVKKQRTDEGAVVVSAKQPKEVGVLATQCYWMLLLERHSVLLYTGLSVNLLILLPI